MNINYAQTVFIVSLQTFPRGRQHHSRLPLQHPPSHWESYPASPPKTWRLQVSVLVSVYRVPQSFSTFRVKKRHNFENMSLYFTEKIELGEQDLKSMLQNHREKRKRQPVSEGKDGFCVFRCYCALITYFLRTIQTWWPLIYTSETYFQEWTWAEKGQCVSEGFISNLESKWKVLPVLLWSHRVDMLVSLPSSALRSLSAEEEVKRRAKEEENEDDQSGIRGSLWKSGAFGCLISTAGEHHQLPAGYAVHPAD